MIKIFGSTSCHACKLLLKELNNKCKDKSIIEYINIDENPELAIKYQIQKLPTTIVKDKVITGFSKTVIDIIISNANL